MVESELSFFHVQLPRNAAVTVCQQHGVPFRFAHELGSQQSAGAQLSRIAPDVAGPGQDVQAQRCELVALANAVQHLTAQVVNYSHGKRQVQSSKAA